MYYVLSWNPLEHLNSEAQSCPLLEFGVERIPRAVRKFIGILTQLTIVFRDRKAFFYFSNVSFCGLFDVYSKISSISFHVSPEEKKKDWLEKDCFI